MMGMPHKLLGMQLHKHLCSQIFPVIKSWSATHLLEHKLCYSSFILTALGQLFCFPAASVIAFKYLGMILCMY